MVVTSPIGDQAPPAFAEITIILAKVHLAFLSAISFLKRAIMTIVVVRLSRTADMKKVIIPMIQISFTWLAVLILSFITVNPWCWSITSTIVMAPKRKKRISAIS